MKGKAGIRKKILNMCKRQVSNFDILVFIIFENTVKKNNCQD